MSDKARFRVEHPTGYVDVFVGEFFGSADDKRQKKLLKLARQHCSDEDRRNLMWSLKKEDDLRKNAIEAVAELERKRCVILGTVFSQAPLPREPGSQEKAMVKQREKIGKVLKQLENERWS